MIRLPYTCNDRRTERWTSEVFGNRVEHKLRDMLLGTPQRCMRPRRTKPDSNAHLRIDTSFVMHIHTTVGHISRTALIVVGDPALPRPTACPDWRVTSHSV